MEVDVDDLQYVMGTTCMLCGELKLRVILL